MEDEWVWEGFDKGEVIEKVERGLMRMNREKRLRRRNGRMKRK